MNELHHRSPSHLRILDYCIFPAQTRRGQAGRLWAGKFEYLSARLLPSVFLKVQKQSEIPFSLLYPRNLLHSLSFRRSQHI